MVRLRKCNRRWMYLGILSLFVVTITVHLLNNSLWADVDNGVKIEIIERAIQSKQNSQRCTIPDLPVFSPEINQFLKHEEPLNCPGTHEDWIRCSQERCTAQPKKLAEHFQLHCTFSEILRKNEYSVEEKDIPAPVTFKSSSDFYVLKHSDYARVKCKSSKTGEKWHGVVIGVRSQVKPRHGKPVSSPYNVLMFGFDSLSRNAFIRKLPKSYAYLVDKIGAHVLNGYNIVGDGTPQALIPILTGYTELELPDTRKRISESVTCDAYPMIWKEYENSGYVTAFNEDLPKVGTFTYRLNGFLEQPTDHYMRPYFLATDSMQSNYEPYCTGDRARHAVFMDYTEQILASQPNTPKFIFSFHGELSHDSINLVEVADEDLLLFLKSFHEKHLHNTILIVMSDHGNRFATIRNTMQGKLEERLPFFSFAFPDDFKRRFAHLHKNFVRNAKEGRLSTPFDINRTLRHILQLNEGGVPEPPNPKKPLRALSLFSAISENRTCADAYIESHWCSCQHWDELSKNDNRAMEAALTVTEHINQLTMKEREICAQLHVDQIMWAGELEVNDDLLRFQGSSDNDGFLGKFTEGKPMKTPQMFQIKLMTKPGGAIYEATVRHSDDAYRVVTQEISRVNMYGDQARCIYDKDPELRKFCYCK